MAAPLCRRGPATGPRHCARDSAPSPASLSRSLPSTSVARNRGRPETTRSRPDRPLELYAARGWASLLATRLTPCSTRRPGVREAAAREPRGVLSDLCVLHSGEAREPGRLVGQTGGHLGCPQHRKEVHGRVSLCSYLSALLGAAISLSELLCSRCRRRQQCRSGPHSCTPGSPPSTVSGTIIVRRLRHVCPLALSDGRSQRRVSPGS